MSLTPSPLVAITGAASGIGLAAAQLLAKQGASLALADNNAEQLESAASALQSQYPSQKFTPTRLDVTDEAAVGAWIRGTVAEHGRPLTGAVNMAGIAPPSIGLPEGTIARVDMAEAKRIVDVHLWGTFNCLRAQLAEGAMVTGENGKGGGSIVNASSIAGLIGMPMNSAYGLSKHAIVGLTRCASKESGAAAIRVNAIAPGYIDTPMTRIGLASQREKGAVVLGGQAPGVLGRFGDAEEMAELIAFLLSDKSQFITGQTISADGGWI